VRTYNAALGQETGEFLGHTRMVWGLDWNSDGRSLVSGSLDDSLRIWNTNSTTRNKVFHTAENSKAQLSDASWIGDGASIALAGNVREFEIIDELSGKSVSSDIVEHAVARFSVSPDGTMIAATTTLDKLLWWHVDSPEEKHVLAENHDDFIHAICWSPDGSQLMTFDLGGGATLWDVCEDRLIDKYQGSGSRYEGCWHPTLPLIAIGNTGGATILDLKSGSESAVPDVSQQVFCIKWSADGKSLAMGTIAGVITIHDGETFELIHRLTDHTGEVRAIDWRSDGKRIATGSSDQTVRIWDTESGQQTLLLDGHIGRVNVVQWSSDYRRLLSADEAGQLRIWDATRGYQQEKSSSGR